MNTRRFDLHQKTVFGQLGAQWHNVLSQRLSTRDDHKAILVEHAIRDQFIDVYSRIVRIAELCVAKPAAQWASVQANEGGRMTNEWPLALESWKWTSLNDAQHLPITMLDWRDVIQSEHLAPTF
jgi:hypothetical protein